MQLGLSYLVCYGSCGCYEHFIGYTRGAGCIDGQSYSGKNIDVVALARDVSLVAKGYRRERASAGEDSAALGPSVGLFRRAFGVRSWIRVGEDDRPPVDSRHRFDHALVEGPGDSADADYGRWLERLDRRCEVPGRRARMRIWLLEIFGVTAGR